MIPDAAICFTNIQKRELFIFSVELYTHTHLSNTHCDIDDANIHTHLVDTFHGSPNGWFPGSNNIGHQQAEAPEQQQPNAIHRYN